MCSDIQVLFLQTRVGVVLSGWRHWRKFEFSTRSDDEMPLGPRTGCFICLSKVQECFLCMDQSHM